MHILDFIVITAGLYYGWRFTVQEGRSTRFEIKYLFRDIAVCLRAELRYFRKQYTKHEYEIWQSEFNEKINAGEPMYESWLATRPRPPWFEVKYHISKIRRSFWYPVRELERLFGNLIYYAPLMWRDQWWDDSYLLEWIERKCRRDAMEYFTKGCHDGHKETAYQIMELAECCRRIREENYCEAEYAAHDKKWGDFEHVDTPLQPFDPDNPDSSGVYEWKITRPGVKTPAQEAQERAEWHATREEAERRQEADVKRIGELFLKVREWWD